MGGAGDGNSRSHHIYDESERTNHVDDETCFFLYLPPKYLSAWCFTISRIGLRTSEVKPKYGTKTGQTSPVRPISNSLTEEA